MVYALDDNFKDLIGTNADQVYYKNGEAKAWTCHAFANYCWHTIFGYDQYDNRYTGGARDKKHVWKNWDDFKKNIKEFARPGDILRADGSPIDKPHSVVIYSIDDDTITFYESGGYGNKHYTIRKITITYEEFCKEFNEGYYDENNNPISWLNDCYYLYHIDNTIYNSVGN